MTRTGHRFGCACAECTSTAAREYYASGPRVRPAPRVSGALDMYTRFDWQMTPKPGEIEYLSLKL